MSSTKKPVAKKRGRPPLAKGQVKAKIVPMRLHDADVKLFEKAAKATKQSLSEWMRTTLREAVEQTMNLTGRNLDNGRKNRTDLRTEVR